MQNLRPILEINLKTIQENYLALRKECPGAEVGAAVKADCYGLGMKKIAPVLKNSGCKHFFVAHLEEAMRLRNYIGESVNKNAEIYVLSGVSKAEFGIYDSHNLLPVLNSLEQIDLWYNYAKSVSRQLPCAVHLDTGMNRLGLSAEEIDKFYHDEYSQYLNITCVMSHLLAADEPSNPVNEKQLELFYKYIQKFGLSKKSLANSNGIFLRNEYHFDIVRPGAALYGLNPTARANDPVIKVPFKVSAPILQLRNVRPGESVGYNATFVNKNSHDIKTATISIGYADGIRRILGNDGMCYIKDYPVPIIGRVSMDLITLDVTNIPESELFAGKLVEVIGKNMTPDKMAKMLSTNYYEIITSLGNRFNRVYNN